MKNMALFLTLAALVCAGWAPAEDITQARKITVTGTAVTTVVPDIIVWNISTTDESMNLQEAKDASDTKLKTLLALVKEMGIPAEDIQTGYLNISRLYATVNGQQQFRGFSVHRGITLRQKDITRFDEYLSRFIASADIEASFQFDSTRMVELRKDTRLKALALAKEKADAMSAVLGCAVGQPLVINEDAPQYPAPFMSGMSNNNKSWSADPSSAAVYSDDAQSTLAPGSIEVRMSVSVVFELK